MAIVLQPKFPIPFLDHNKSEPQNDDEGITEIGWCDGVLADGRPFRAEMWAQDQVSMLTIFFSEVGLEQHDQDVLRKLVEAEGLITFAAQPSCIFESSIIKDDAGNRMWSVNIPVGDEDHTFLVGSVPIFRYSGVNEPDTMFNPLPIKTAQTH